MTATALDILTVEQVRLAAVKLNAGMPQWCENWAIEGFLRNLREHPDFEIMFWSLNFPSGYVFAEAMQKAATG